MNVERPSVAVIGAGAGGLGTAAYLLRKGYTLRLWNRDFGDEATRWIEPIRASGVLEIVGWQDGILPVERATTDLREAVDGAKILFIVTTADAHVELGEALAPLLGPDQLVILVSGGTGAALDFRNVFLKAGGATSTLIAEAISTMVNSRIIGPGRVEVLGEKRDISLATLPSDRGEEAIQRLVDLPFVAVADVLVTSMANFSAALHAVPMVLNAARLEDPAGQFLYYRQGISPAVARVMEEFEGERHALAAALGFETESLVGYLANSLGASGADLYELINTCDLYATVPAPSALDSRYLWEDVEAGVVPMVSLARSLGVSVPIMEATLTLASSLVGRDLEKSGRTLDRLGLAGLDAQEIREVARTGRHQEL